jgi:hypothetical protein
MNTEELITFRRFNDIALAYQLAEFLKSNNVTYYLEELPATFDPAFRLKDPDSKEYVIKIKGDDFQLAEQLLTSEALKGINDVEADYYLLDFTDEELKDVLAKADEWNEFDVQLAKKLLKDRGNINDQEVGRLNEQRLLDLKQPEKSQNLWLIIGYICAFGGGILGFFIGWHISTSKKTLPNGERVFEYSDRDRKNGRIIFIISLIVFPVLFGLKLIKNIPGL